MIILIIAIISEKLEKYILNAYVWDWMRSALKLVENSRLKKNSAFLGKIFFTELFGNPPNYSVGDRIIFKKRGGGVH